MIVLRATLAFAAVTLLCVGTARAAACSSKPQPIKGGALLATMEYWPRPGQTDVLYQSLLADNQMLKRHGLRQYNLYKSSSSDGPALVWTISFPSVKAHDAWLDSADKIHESAAELANDKRMESATARVVHSHYVLHDGWAQTSCP